jgi:hypothetical protein
MTVDAPKSVINVQEIAVGGQKIVIHEGLSQTDE